MIIGSDETLKGDSFGGLVVCAVKLDDDMEAVVRGMGVRDSKRLSPIQIELIAERLKELVPFAVRELNPAQYNQEVSKYGLTGVLNKLHQAVIEELREDGYRVVVDQYPGCKVKGAESLTKAEDQFTAVAAASIIARSVGMEQFKMLSEKAGMRLPLGSTHVKEALERMKASGKDLEEFAKTGFKNVRAVLDQ